MLFGIVFSFAAVHAPELFGLAGNVRNGSLSFHQHLVQVLLQAALLYTVSSDALPGLTHRLWLRRTKLCTFTTCSSVFTFYHTDSFKHGRLPATRAKR